MSDINSKDTSLLILATVRFLVQKCTSRLLSTSETSEMLHVGVTCITMHKYAYLFLFSFIVGRAQSYYPCLALTGGGSAVKTLSKDSADATHVRSFSSPNPNDRGQGPSVLEEIMLKTLMASLLISGT
jgi:hypothetical protein